MISRTTDGFWKCYRKLPEHIRKEAKKAYKSFKSNPYHPGLHFKRAHSTRPIFSLRITKDYRAVGIEQDKQIIWFWIGSHGDYDKLLKQLRTAQSGKGRLLTVPPHTTTHAGLPQGHFRWARTWRFVEVILRQAQDALAG